VSVDLLELPSPRALARHLRIPFPPAPAADIADRAAEGLGTEFSVLDGLNRIAGLPCILPRHYLTALGRALIDAKAANSGDIGIPATPLYGLTLVEALATIGSTADGMLRTQVEQASEAVEQIGPLFCAVLRFGARIADGAAEWVELTDNVYAVLLWAYADFVTGSLVSAGADPEGMVAIIDGLRPSPVAHTLAPAPRAAWADRLVRHADEQSLCARIVAALLGHVEASALGAALRERLQRAAGHFLGAAGWLPALEVAFPPVDAPSWIRLPNDPVDAFVRAGWLPPEHPFATRRAESIVQELLAGDDPESGRLAAAGILSYAPLDRLPDVVVRQIVDFLENIPIDPARLDDAAVQNALVLKSKLLGGLGEGDRMRAALSRLAAGAADRWKTAIIGCDNAQTSVPYASAFDALTVAAFQFAKAASGTLDQKLETFANGMRTVALNWPGALKGAIGVLDRMSGNAPTEATGGLWKALWELRAMR